MSQRKLIGYVMFRTDSGAVYDAEVDLIRSGKDARNLAREILLVQKRSDRYADPGHEDHLPDVAAFYGEQMERATRLESCSLNENDDLIILAVYDVREDPGFAGIFDKVKRLLRRCRNFRKTGMPA